MFDRPTEPATSPSWPSSDQDSVDRLCALYDGLIQAPDATLTAEAAGELHAMAGIFDLDTDRPHAEVWKDLRTVVTRQTGSDTLARPAPAQDGEPLTILVVEDDAETAADMVETLAEAGHRVVGPFQSAEAAEAAAAQYSLDLALLDINLSGETTGVELAESLKSRWGTRIIFVSGDVTVAARHAHLSEAMLIKPYSGTQLLGVVARFGGDSAVAAV